jgi:S-formylglutathione hydrolase
MCLCCCRVQGDGDKFYKEKQLLPENFEAACKSAGMPVELRMQPGYDHSYFFIASFVEDHIQHHAKALGL